MVQSFYRTENDYKGESAGRENWSIIGKYKYFIKYLKKLGKKAVCIKKKKGLSQKVNESLNVIVNQCNEERKLLTLNTEQKQGTA